ncbi:MAG: glycosyl transferase group 1, partial [Solirubrobacterales bacterium]|nr:glycosyl transferase group 1 [Solirubrobacterales bacterium]
NAGSDAWWTAVELPRRARRTGADLIHHPLPALCPAAPVPQVVTVHDLAFERVPECFDPAFRRWASLTHRAAARHAAVVVCVSRTTLTDVRARWGVPEERLVLARHGPGQDVDASRPRSGTSHLLYVGDDEPRKNLRLLLDAHRRLHAQARAGGGAPPPLVLAGTARPPGGHQEGVVVVDRPEPRLLASLLADALALVLPSLHEGFGLTALEAMAAGVPVVAARSPGVTETCGDAALYTSRHNPEDLARVLARVTGDAALRRDLSERGRRHAAEFSWARAARAHVQAYNLALDG